ncbi:MAG TPA: NUDIX hydrolase [Patescibacteria group bacterium]|nr:NUDIX hydrolase [Patescibacteria group bacterium]
MKRALVLFAEGIGVVLFWLAWPAYQVYFRRGERTRVLLVDGEKTLVLKGWVSDGTWNLAGGGLHQQEDPAVGAIREVQEETGLALDASQLQYMGKATYHKAGLHFAYHRFFAAVSTAQPLARQRHEIAEMQWVPIGSLTPKNASQEVHDCIAAARANRLLQ